MYFHVSGDSGAKSQKDSDDEETPTGGPSMGGMGGPPMMGGPPGMGPGHGMGMAPGMGMNSMGAMGGMMPPMGMGPMGPMGE